MTPWLLEEPLDSIDNRSPHLNGADDPRDSRPEDEYRKEPIGDDDRRNACAFWNTRC